MYNIEKIRADFPLLSNQPNEKYPYVYLDSGATAQKPQVVIDKIKYIYEHSNSNIHRGVHRLSGVSTVEYEQARREVCRFIGGASEHEVIFTSGATQSINLVAHSYGARFIHKGDVIVVSEMEHHANIVPWQLLCERSGAEIRVFPFNDNGELAMDNLNDIVSEGVKLVAVTQASNVLGTHPDLPKIIARAHEVGAVVMVDGCQGIVHDPVDVKALDCDFYAFSGHKLYAPTGIGVLYGKEELLRQMPPYMGGGDMVAHVSFSGTTYADLPLKFEAGTTPYVEAIALGEAIRYVESIGMENIRDHEKQLYRLAYSEICKIEQVIVYGTVEGKSPILSFNIKEAHPLDVGMILDKMGVAVRTGTHCAEPVMTHYGVGGMVRATFALYNTEKDVQQLIKAVQTAVNMLVR